MKFLVVYASTDGQTARISDRMAQAFRELGHEAACFDAGALPPGLEPAAFDGILVGASVHAEGYQRRIGRFIRRDLAALRDRPSAFYSVCMGIASKDPKGREHALEIPRTYVAKLGWIPDVIEVFAGALTFSRYGFLRRPIMRWIAKREMGNVDTHRDYEFTDWEHVDTFIRRFADAVEARRETPAPSAPLPQPEA